MRRPHRPEESATVEAQTERMQQRRPVAAVCAAIPFLALTLGVVFANHLEPRILGLPFVLAWIVLWVVLTPAFLWAAYRSQPW